MFFLNMQHFLKKGVFAFFILLNGFVFSFCNDVLAQNFTVVDTRARREPVIEGLSKQDVVNHLIKGLKSDEQKARVLASYIAYQFQRNGYDERELEKASMEHRLADNPLPNNFFKTRIGNSFEFAQLYQELCSLAGLEAVVVKGFAGHSVRASQSNNIKLHALESGLKQWTRNNYNLQRYQAAWNVVRLNGKWALVDTYWMIRSDKTIAKDIDSEKKMRRFLSQREKKQPSLRELTSFKELDNDYFNANPRRFVKTHYPLDNQWQLLPVPISWSTFISN